MFDGILNKFLFIINFGDAEKLKALFFTLRM